MRRTELTVTLIQLFHRSIWLWSSAVFLAVALAACSLGPIPSGSATTGSGGAGGDEGGESGCHCVDDDPTDCRQPSCVDGECVTQLLEAGTACGDGSDGRVCDTAGSCALALGQACTDGDSCASKLCVDNACCESLCDGVCETCKQAGAEGSCVPLPAGTDEQSECTDSMCNGERACGGELIAANVLGAKDKDGEGKAVTHHVAIDEAGDVTVVGHFRNQLLDRLGTVNIGGVGQGAAAFYRDYFALGLDGQKLEASWSSYNWNGSDTVQSGLAVALTAASTRYVALKFAGDTTFYPDTQAFPSPSASNYHTAVVLALDPQMAAAPIKQSAQITSDLDVFPRGLARRSDGYLVLAGVHNGTIQHGGFISSAGTQNLWVAVLDPADLSMRSLTSWPNVGEVPFLEVIAHDDVVFVVGQNAEDAGPLGEGAFALRISGAADAPMIESQNWGSSDLTLSLSGAAVSATDELVLSGTVAGPGELSFGDDSLTVSSGAKQMFVSKFAWNGTSVFNRSYGNGPNDQLPPSVGVDAQGRVVLAGSLRGEVEIGGQMLDSAVDTPLLIKLDEAGNYMWHRMMQCNRTANFNGVALQSSGDMVLTASWDVEGGGAQCTFGEQVLDPVGEEQAIMVLKLGP